MYCPVITLSIVTEVGASAGRVERAVWARIRVEAGALPKGTCGQALGLPPRDLELVLLVVFFVAAAASVVALRVVAVGPPGRFDPARLVGASVVEVGALLSLAPCLDPISPLAAGSGNGP